MPGSDVRARVRDFEDMEPGDVCAGGQGSGPKWLAICCPGCGQKSALNIRPHGIEGQPSWELTGWPEAPTLSPSVIHVCGWHGWLRQGVWKRC